MSKRFLIIMGVLVVLFFGFLVFGKSNDSADAPTDLSKGSNHVKGESSTGVTLLEFGDFQCSACAAFYPLIKDIEKKYDGEISFQYRHFPLVQLHDKAMIAHRAAEAAGKQGKFFEMHDILYERQKIWSESENATRIMEDYATELALNIDTFKSDFASATVNDVISADIKIGQDQGASATPTFVLDGKVIEDAPSDIEGFSKLIDEAIANKSQ